MFYGRRQELAKLNAMYEGSGFEMAVVYGRRRVGKTALISEFCRGKRAIFFSALESTAGGNLAAFSAALTESLDGIDSPSPVYTDFPEILRKIGTMARDERLVLAIDEYPWLAQCVREFSSLLQNAIDHSFKETKLFIILCGSSVSFMQNDVLGEKSPLFGRRTAQLHIQPMPYCDMARFWGWERLQDSALAYGVTGGIPMYGVMVRRGGGSIDESIISNFFTVGSYLYDEPSNLLKQELRELRSYNAIAAAITGGAARLNEIAERAGIQPPLCLKYIDTLMELGILKREVPITENKRSRRSIYVVDDLMFRFWFRFVPPCISLIESGRGRDAFRYRVKPLLDAYMGGVFEKMCREYIFIRMEKFPIPILDVGRWWGSDPQTQQQEEIDLVGLSMDGEAALFCECKYRNEPADVDVLKKLQCRSQLIHGSGERYFAIFSKSGFTKELENEARRGCVTLVSLADMYA